MALQRPYDRNDAADEDDATPTRKLDVADFDTAKPPAISGYPSVDGRFRTGYPTPWASSPSGAFTDWPIETPSPNIPRPPEPAPRPPTPISPPRPSGAPRPNVTATGAPAPTPLPRITHVPPRRPTMPPPAGTPQRAIDYTHPLTAMDIIEYRRRLDLAGHSTYSFNDAEVHYSNCEWCGREYPTAFRREVLRTIHYPDTKKNEVHYVCPKPSDCGERLAETW